MESGADANAKANANQLSSDGKDLHRSAQQ